MSKANTLEDVIKVADKLGYEVLDKEYINTITEMGFKCKGCGIIRHTSFNNLKHRYDCENCRNIKLRTLELERYLRLVNSLGRNTSKEELTKNKFSYTKLNNYCVFLGYGSFEDFKTKYNIGKPYNQNKLKLEDITDSYKWFYDKYNRFPTSKDCSEHKELHSRNVTTKILNENNISLRELCMSISGGKEDKYTRFIGLEAEDYDKYKNKYINLCKSLVEPISIHKLSSYDLPSSRWFVDYCPNKEVKTYVDFYKWCGITRIKDITKEEAIETIYKMQSELNRPLMYDDFRNPSLETIGITTVKKYWKTMNKMKVELGLEVIQEDMTCKHIEDFELVKQEINYICDTIYIKENRKTIMVKDINKHNRLQLKYSSLNKICTNNNITIRDLITNYGFEFQKEGNGMVIYNDDGEITKSSYEHIFSNKLKELGYKYNKDYFRDIRYKTFIDNYEEKMDCDYKIYIDNRVIYIEVAGMLSKNYEKLYKSPELMYSKSKKLYAEKLNLKENMFIDNGLEYFILFPSDLKDEKLDELFENILNIKQNKKELST